MLLKTQSAYIGPVSNDPLRALERVARFDAFRLHQVAALRLVLMDPDDVSVVLLLHAPDRPLQRPVPATDAASSLLDCPPAKKLSL